MRWYQQLKPKRFGIQKYMHLSLQMFLTSSLCSKLTVKSLSKLNNSDSSLVGISLLWEEYLDNYLSSINKHLRLDFLEYQLKIFTISKFRYIARYFTFISIVIACEIKDTKQNFIMCSVLDKSILIAHQ